MFLNKIKEYKMSLILKLKKDSKTKKNYINLKDLSIFFEDISVVDTYKIKELGEKCLSLTFYDKDGNLIKIKEGKK